MTLLTSFPFSVRKSLCCCHASCFIKAWNLVTKAFKRCSGVTQGFFDVELNDACWLYDSRPRLLRNTPIFGNFNIPRSDD